MKRTHGDTLAIKRRENGQVGVGSQQVELPQMVRQVWDNFSGGFQSLDVAHNGNDQASIDSVDFYVNTEDQLVRMPGVRELYSTALSTRTPRQLIAHGGLDGSSELVLLDAPFSGYIAGTAQPVWSSVSLPAGYYTHAQYADTLLLAIKSATGLYSRSFGGVPTVIAGSPSGAAVTVFAGRVFIGNTRQGTADNPLGVQWNGVEELATSFGTQTSGFELLIDDTSRSDYIRYMKALSNSMLVVMMRRSIWVGSPTGDAIRPADITPRVQGIGLFGLRTVAQTPAGLLFLSDDGVRLFDGTTQLISKPIASWLLPLDPKQEDQYVAVYDDERNQYMLSTPTDSFVFDLAERRWYRRAMQVDDYCLFAEQYTSPYVGSVSDGGFTLYPIPEGKARLLSLHGQRIGVLDDTLESILGKPVTPTWETPIKDAVDRQLAYHLAHITYQGRGTLSIALPDTNGQYKAHRNVTLEESTRVKTVTASLNAVGNGVGIRVALLEGDVRISRLAVTAYPRGPVLGVK